MKIVQIWNSARLSLFIMILTAGCRKATHSDQNITDWKPAAYMLAHRTNALKLAGESGPSLASSYTLTYFRALKQRRDAVQAWASRANPEVVFFGQNHPHHLDPNSTTPESLAKMRRQHTIIFENVKREATDAQVIGAEENRCRGDELYTQEVNLRILKEDVLQTQGVEIGDDLAREIDASNPMAQYRALRELPIPSVCGEEWTKDLQSHMMEQLATSAQLKEEQLQIIEFLYFIRSEMILIRTLEALQRMRGHKALIIQGELHRPQIETLAPSYHIRLRTYPAPSLN